MTNDQMREAFEAMFNQDASQKYPDGRYRSPVIQRAWEASQAAYAAGMERAAGICEDVHQRYACCEDSKVCADEIRAEIPKEKP